MNIHVVDWAGPTQTELRAIRESVFIREQHVPKALEWDGADPQALHLLARIRGEAVGTARMLPDGHIGRVAVLPPWRGHGIATAMMQRLLAIAREQGLAEVWLDAQTSALPLYEKLGFTAEGEEFLDAGLPHRRMRRAV